MQAKTYKKLIDETFMTTLKSNKLSMMDYALLKTFGTLTVDTP